ncbi:MAG: sulfatase-like hydrolase/transferase [Turneriella sp.]|nr:sulfatase-like hydrolase/transferase [Turneriella sp.]
MARVLTLIVLFQEESPGAIVLSLTIAPAAVELAIASTIRRNIAPLLSPPWRNAGAVLLNLLYAAALTTELRVLAAFQRPLDFALYREGVEAMTVATMLALLRWYDIALLLLPLAGFFIPAFLQHSSFRVKTAIFFPAITVPLGIFLLPTGIPSYAVLPPVLRIPLLAVASKLDELRARPAREHPDFAVLPDIVPEVLHSKPPETIPNIVFVVLESTGVRYAFDAKLTLPGNGVPMPFLHSLRREGLYLARHYATANSSPRALFSLFTGLYPEPTERFFSLKSNLQVKGWLRYLPRFNGIVVTPCFTEWYFPKALFRNNGFSDIIGKNQLIFRERQTEPADARNEIQTADFFAGKLLALAEPFFAVYISFVPHYPYHDYGPRWRVTAGRTRFERYVNNLRLLDAQIEKFFHALRQRGILDRTLVVLVGDHGEAFQQHPGNFIHSLHSYEENLAVPALIWYPRQLPAREIHFPTSHVDIGPSVLDLLRLPHHPREFQGISLLRHYRRKHILAYGNEGTITVYSHTLHKLQRLRDGSCRMFDLKADADEKMPLPCNPSDGALRLAGSYAHFQPAFLEQLDRPSRKD